MVEKVKVEADVLRTLAYEAEANLGEGFYIGREVEMEETIAAAREALHSQRKEYKLNEIKKQFAEMECSSGVITYKGYIAGTVPSKIDMNEVKKKFESEYEATVTIDKQCAEPENIMVDIKPEDWP